MRLDIPKLIDTDEGQFHYCVTCEDYKPVSEFYKCPKCKTGYQYSCITCHRVRWRELNPEPISDEEALKFIFNKMGYDTTGDKTINEQFIERVFEWYIPCQVGLRIVQGDSQQICSKKNWEIVWRLHLFDVSLKYGNCKQNNRF